MVLDEEHPVYGPFFGVMGAAAAIIFSGELSAEFSKKKKMEEVGEKISLCEKFRQSLIIKCRESFVNAILVFQCSSWSRLRNRQVRNRNCGHECHETWADYEIHHSRCHGWYHCYLRSGRCRSHRWCTWGTLKIHIVQVSSIFCHFSRFHFRVMWPAKKNQWSLPIPLNTESLRFQDSNGYFFKLHYTWNFIQIADLAKNFGGISMI